MTGFRPLSAPLNRPIRLSVLISGGGTTLTNLVSQIQSGALSAEIPVVIASRPDCGGIQRAAEAGLRCEVVQRAESPATPPENWLRADPARIAPPAPRKR